MTVLTKSETLNSRKCVATGAMAKRVSVHPIIKTTCVTLTQQTIDAHCSSLRNNKKHLSQCDTVIPQYLTISPGFRIFFSWFDFFHALQSMIQLVHYQKDDQT